MTERTLARGFVASIAVCKSWIKARIWVLLRSHVIRLFAISAYLSKGEASLAQK